MTKKVKIDIEDNNYEIKTIKDLLKVIEDKNTNKYHININRLIKIKE